MNSTDAMDALLGPWQDADRGRALHRLSELYYDRKEAIKDAITEPGIAELLAHMGDGHAPSGSSPACESLRDAMRDSLAELLAWYWKTTRAIIEFYETRGE